MKKLVCAAVVLAEGSLVFASQVPQQKPVVQVNGLRASSDAIAIPAAKRRLDRDGDVGSLSSSGSSPVGAEHLFPGQSGLGQWGKYMAPVCPADCNFKGRNDFFH